MPESLTLELRTSNTTDVGALKKTFVEELSKQNADLKISEMQEVQAVGMTTPDIILSIIISVGSSAAVHVYRDQVDAAAKATGQFLKTDVRTLFKNKQKSIEDE